MLHIPSILQRDDVDELAYVTASLYAEDLQQKQATLAENRQRQRRGRLASILLWVLITAGVVTAAVLFYLQQVELGLVVCGLTLALGVALAVGVPRLRRPIPYASARWDTAKAYWRVVTLPDGAGGAFVVDALDASGAGASFTVSRLDLASVPDLPDLDDLPHNAASLSAEKRLLESLGQIATDLTPVTEQHTLPLLPPDAQIAPALNAVLAAARPSASPAPADAGILPGLPDEEIARIAAAADRVSGFLQRPFGADPAAAAQRLDQIDSYAKRAPERFRSRFDATPPSAPASAAPPASAALKPAGEAVGELFAAVTASLDAEVRADIEAAKAPFTNRKAEIRLRYRREQGETERTRDADVAQVERQLAAFREQLKVAERNNEAAQASLKQGQADLAQAERQARDAAAAVVAAQSKLAALKDKLADAERDLAGRRGDEQALETLRPQVAAHQRQRDDLKAEADAAASRLQGAQARLAEAKRKLAGLETTRSAPAPAAPASASTVTRLQREIAEVERQLQQFEGDARLENRLMKLNSDLQRAQLAAAPPAGPDASAASAAADATLQARAQVEAAQREVDAADAPARTTQRALRDADAALAALKQKQGELENRIRAASGLENSIAGLKNDLARQNEALPRLQADEKRSQDRWNESKPAVERQREAAQKGGLEAEGLRGQIAAGEAEQRTLRERATAEINRLSTQMNAEIAEQDRQMEASVRAISGHVDALREAGSRAQRKIAALRQQVTAPAKAAAPLEPRIISLRTAAVQAACERVAQALGQQREILAAAQTAAAGQRWLRPGASAGRDDCCIPVWFTRPAGAAWSLMAVGPFWSPQPAGDNPITIQIDARGAALPAHLDGAGLAARAAALLDAQAGAQRSQAGPIGQALGRLHDQGLISADLAQHVRGVLAG